MLRSPLRLSSALAGVIAATSVCNHAYAIEWALEPAITVGTNYNDNIFLTSAPHQSVSGTNISPSLDVSASQETWDLRSSMRWTDRRYSGRSDLNTDDASASLSGSYKTERNLWQVKGGYANESTASGNQLDPDIGLTQVLTKRTSKSVNPSWLWLLAERTQLNLDYQDTDAHYDKGISANLLDYQQQSTSLSLSDQWTSRTRLNAVAAYSEFRITTSESAIVTSYTPKSRTSSVQFGIAHDFSPILKGSLSAGPRQTVSENILQTYGCFFLGFPTCIVPVSKTTTSHGTVFSASLESSLERTHAAWSLGRTIDASGSGSQVEASNVSFRIDRQLTLERLSAQFAADGYLVRSLSAATSTDRNYYTLATTLTWRWTQNLTATGFYRYTRQRYVDSADYSDSNAIGLSLSYRWTKLSLSR